MSQEAAESGLEDVLPAGYAARGGALIDYAGLVSAIAAADVLAGECGALELGPRSAAELREAGLAL